MDLDAFADSQGYVPAPTKIPVKDRLNGPVREAIIAGRAKGYSWKFIVAWLAEEHDITISSPALNAFITGAHPETR